MEENEIDIGTSVVFRDYEDISDEHRDRKGIERVPFSFPADMKRLCGTEATVIRTESYLGRLSIILDPRPERGEGDYFLISKEMLCSSEKLNRVPSDDVEFDLSILLV